MANKNEELVDEIEDIGITEFRKKYHKPNKKWKFDLFKIKCSKCDSERVEFNSNMELESGFLESGYYNDYSVQGCIVVKCHKCGNAMTLNFWDLEK
jgi:ribosomal protein S27E